MQLCPAKGSAAAASHASFPLLDAETRVCDPSVIPKIHQAHRDHRSRHNALVTATWHPGDASCGPPASSSAFPPCHKTREGWGGNADNILNKSAVYKVPCKLFTLLGRNHGGTAAGACSSQCSCGSGADACLEWVQAYEGKKRQQNPCATHSPSLPGPLCAHTASLSSLGGAAVTLGHKAGWLCQLEEPHAPGKASLRLQREHGPGGWSGAAGRVASSCCGKPT